MTIDVGDTPTEAKALLVRGHESVDIVNGVPDKYVAVSTKVEDRERAARSGPPEARAGGAMSTERNRDD